jgi:hypothetical protein
MPLAAAQIAGGARGAARGVSTAHVKMATGRDYRDVPPTWGTFRGIAEEHLRVAVETRSIE